ncbi:MAG TPA: chloride channel protein [Stellaceae bacterium]|nr:chloride channel protein [Stellaceae bacterium]
MKRAFPRPPVERTINLIELSIIALVIGVLTGGGAVLFRAFVAFIHDATFLGTIGFYYNSNLHTPMSWLGPLVMVSPVVGGLVVIFLIRMQPEDRRGQGVSDVIDAIYYREGRVRAFSGIVKSFAAGVQSATGGSVGLEAASVQIGAAFASRISRLTGIAQWQRMTLVAAGGASGLAAAFNAPLGSTMFAIELMMPEVSPRTLLPVTIACGAGTFVSRFYYGLQPTFLVQTVTAAHLRVSGLVALLPFLPFGVLLGITSWFMIWMLGWAERQFAKISPSPYLRHIIGMLAVGIIAYLMITFTGNYYVEGPSYAALQDILHGRMVLPLFFLLLFAAKILAVGLTLGSGGSGGVFSASLMLGGALGGALGSTCLMLWPHLDVTIVDFAIVGMAGQLAATIGAPITAIVMVFELTRDYNVIVPMIMCVTLAIAVRRALVPQSIYTYKLFSKGHEVPDALQANMFRIRHAESVMATDFEVRPAAATIEETVVGLAETGRPIYLMIADGKRLKGYVRLDPGFKLWQAREPEMTLGDMARTDYILARSTDAMFDLIGRVARRGARLVIVVRPARVPRVADVIGVIALETMGEAVIDNARAYAPAPPSRNPFPLLYRRRITRPVQFWRRRGRNDDAPK